MQALAFTSCCTMAMRAGWASALNMAARRFCFSLNISDLVAPKTVSQYYDEINNAQKIFLLLLFLHEQTG
jgi:hypothetical protein